MLARIAASLQWLGVVARSILVFARKLFGVRGEQRKLVVDKVLVMSCYYSKVPIANIVRLVPPVEVMHGEPVNRKQRLRGCCVAFAIEADRPRPDLFHSLILGG